MGRGFFSRNTCHFWPNPETSLCHLTVSSLLPSLSTFSPFLQLGLAQQDAGIPSPLVVFVSAFPPLPAKNRPVNAPPRFIFNESPTLSTPI